MKAADIKEGSTYHIHTGRLGITRVKVTSVWRTNTHWGAKSPSMWRATGTNLSTGREITLKSATHFVRECDGGGCCG